jgi:predicted Ser/Thr protein kinase
MSHAEINPAIGIMVVVQQVLLNAILASRFDPKAFEEKAKEARKQLKQITSVGAGPELVLYEKQFDALLAAFQTGDVLPEVSDGRAH